jgi:hypothetical protein
MFLENYNVYLLLGVNSFFTAFGTLIANFLWSEVFKPRLEKWHKKIKRKRFLSAKKIFRN